MRMAGGQDSLRCDYCKNIYFSPPDDEGVRFLDEALELLCPVCMVPLWNATLAGLPLCICKRRRGMSIKMPVFEPLVEQMRAERGGGATSGPVDGADLDRRIDCPSCRHPMETHLYYGGGRVAIADCERCEANWLDGGALMRIARAQPPD